MCIKTITAYQDSKGGMYPLETTALIAEAAIQTGASLAILQGLFGHAATLIPLLQRHVEIAAAAPTAKPVPETTKKDPALRRSSLLGRIQAWGQDTKNAGDVGARNFLVEQGYQNLSEINNTAVDEAIEDMHRLLDQKGVA